MPLFHALEVLGKVNHASHLLSKRLSNGKKASLRIYSLREVQNGFYLLWSIQSSKIFRDKKKGPPNYAVCLVVPASVQRWELSFCTFLFSSSLPLLFVLVSIPATNTSEFNPTKLKLSNSWSWILLESEYVAIKHIMKTECLLYDPVTCILNKPRFPRKRALIPEFTARAGRST